MTALVTASGEAPPWQETQDGMSWGRVVHRFLDAYWKALGRSDLGGLGRRIVAEEGRDMEEERRLTDLLATLCGGEIWGRALASPERCTEVPIPGLVGEETVVSGVVT